MVGVRGLRYGQTGGSSISKPQAQEQRIEDSSNILPPGMMLPAGTSEK